MRARKRHSVFAVVLVLGIGLPGFIGILAVQAKAVAHQSAIINAVLQAGSTSTPTPSQIQATSTSSPVIISTPSASTSSVYAFIQAPVEPVPQPYVILTAFAAHPQGVSITIRGFVNSQEFVCTQSPCTVTLQSSSRFVFGAFTDSGQSSEEVIASVTVTQGQDGYLVSIDSVSQFTVFNNSCSIAWAVSDQDDPVTWDDFVQFPYEIHTKKTYHTLVTQLLLNGIVKANDCPAGGLSVGLSWPTACGLERASSKMIEWQNQFDNYIWLASKEQGIPPKILKTLIGIESQFWPGNQRFYLDEFGLGQINQLGVDVLLRRDPTLYLSVCPSVLSDCTKPYLSLEPEQQAMIRGAVVSLTDAACSNCPNGIDLDKAKESVSLLARIVKANCQQVDSILGTNISDASYEDLWRFTFASYHSGSSCLQQAVQEVDKEKKLPVTWQNVSEELSCKGGADYVNGFMDTLSSFDFYLFPAADASVAIAVPTSYLPGRLSQHRLCLPQVHMSKSWCSLIAMETNLRMKGRESTR